MDLVTATIAVDVFAVVEVVVVADMVLFMLEIKTISYVYSVYLPAMFITTENTHRRTLIVHSVYD